MVNNLSTIIFIFGILLSLILSFFAEYNKKNQRFYLVSLVLVLSFFLAFRSNSVGTDTNSYLEKIYLLRHYSFNFKESDFGFNVISWLLVSIFNSERMVIIIYAITTVFFFVYGIWTFRSQISFPLAVLVFIANSYVQSFNLMRQLLSISFVFFAYCVFLKNRKYFLFSFFALVATSIHASSIVSLLFLIIYFIFDKKKKKHRPVYYFAVALIIIFATIVAFTSSAMDKYNIYLSGNYLSRTGGTNYTLAFAIFIVLFSFLTEGKAMRDLKNNDYKVLSFLYLLALFFGAFVSQYRFVFRVALVLSSFSFVFWCDKKNEQQEVRYLKMAFIVLVSCYSLYSSINAGGNGITPYYFLWEGASL